MARRATSARGCWPLARATTRSWESSAASRTRSSSAILSTRPRRSVRWRVPGSASASRGPSRRAAPRGGGGGGGGRGGGRGGGAGLVGGGARPPEQDRGWFVQPTIFADVDNSDTIAREEIFGPVLAVIPYDGADDAVAIA